MHSSACPAIWGRRWGCLLFKWEQGTWAHASATSVWACSAFVFRSLRGYVGAHARALRTAVNRDPQTAVIMLAHTSPPWRLELQIERWWEKTEQVKEGENLGSQPVLNAISMQPEACRTRKYSQIPPQLLDRRTDPSRGPGEPSSTHPSGAAWRKVASPLERNIHNPKFYFCKGKVSQFHWCKNLFSKSWDKQSP